MRKGIIAIVCLVCIAALGALEVDRKELDPGSAGGSIEFINYSGPQTVIDTVQEIRGIGTALGSGLIAKGSSGDRNRYYVIHAVDPSVKAGFDADILILGPGAGIDHIDNLRRIISSYLTAAYGYSAKDADTLATFITVYNAVYRGKLETFKTRYKPIVLNNLTADKVGMSVRYDEWAGRSQIVIPLSDARLAGSISTIDTSSLTDQEVVKKIKEEPGKAVDTRKDMVDLKERESTAAQERAVANQAEATKTRNEAAQKKEELTTAQKEAQAAQIAADTAKKEAEAKPGDAAARKDAAEAQKVADTKVAVVEQKKEEVASVQENLAQKEETAKADQTLADTKQKETQVERKDIANDIQKDLNEKSDAAKAATDAALASAMPAYCLKVVDTDSYLGGLVLVNLNDGTILKTSTINSIRGRTLYDTGSGLMAIAGKKSGNAAIKLVLIDQNSLEMTKQGTDQIAEASVLVQSMNDYYAVIEQKDGSFVIGRFDKALEAKAKSALTVMPYTPITVTAKGLLVQDSKGAIKLLRATDLIVQSE